MVNYIGDMIEDTPVDMKVESATPVAHHFFYITGDATKLSLTYAELFHNFVVQLLYLSN